MLLWCLQLYQVILTSHHHLVFITLSSLAPYIKQTYQVFIFMLWRLHRACILHYAVSYMYIVYNALDLVVSSFSNYITYYLIYYYVSQQPPYDQDRPDITLRLSTEH